MRMTMALVAALALTVAAPAASQDEEVGSAPESASEDAREVERTPRRTIRVLQHPYDLASFYRSRDQWWGAPPPTPADPAYGLASFYRSDRSGPVAPPWAAFWAAGYAPRPTGYAGYRRSIGENGEIFLAVPFLAPVGPLSGAFFGY